MNRRPLALAFLATLSTACGGSGGDPVTPPPPPPPAAVATITLSAIPAELEVNGRSATVQATLKSNSGATLTGRSIAWTTSSSSIATIGSTGVITGNSPGIVTVTATSEGISATSSNITVDTRTAFLNAIVEGVRQTYDLPALAGAIVTRGGGVFGAGVSGRRRLSSPTQATVNDLWHIGSNLKAITAHVAAIAVGEGVISWNTTLQQAYPELAGSMRVEYRTVTLRQLLGHLGGITPNVENNAVAGNGTLKEQRAAIAGWATTLAASPAVGQFNYSNVGYMIAANMIERAMNSTWEDLMQTRLLTPLAVTAFGWGPAPEANNPIGHQRSGATTTEWPTSDNPPFLSAAGRSHWSIAAYAKVLQDIMKSDQGSGGLATQVNARVNTTAQSSGGYGSGWFTNTGGWATTRGVSHDGSNNLNYARTQIALDRGVAVFGVTNSHDITGGSTRSNDAMLSLTSKLWTYYEQKGP